MRTRVEIQCGKEFLPVMLEILKSKGFVQDKAYDVEEDSYDLKGGLHIWAFEVVLVHDPEKLEELENTPFVQVISPIL